VSLDTLDPQRFAHTDQPQHARAGARRHRQRSARRLHGHEADTVVMRGSTTTSWTLSSSSARRCRPRCASSSTWTWAAPRVVHGQGRQPAEMLERLGRAALRADRAGRETSTAPADRFGCPTGRPSASSRPHRAVLRRLRPQPLTADGLCTSVSTRRAASTCAGVPTRRRPGARDAQGAHHRRLARARPIAARGPAGARQCQPLVQISGLKRDPHLEMHTRGG